MRIVFTGGGTGGHIFPILAVVRELKRLAEDALILDLVLFYFGPEAFARDLLREEDVMVVSVPAGKLRRYVSLFNVTDVFRTAAGAAIALWKMFLVMPDMVFAKGGYGSFPTLLAARIFRIPVIIHESDAVPGRVNRWAGRFAVRIAVSFPAASRHFPEGRTALTGVPVRRRILSGNIEQAREALGVFSDRPGIFVTGGFQGSAAINRTLIGILQELVLRYECIHQTGEGNFEDVRLESAPLLGDQGVKYYHPLAFLYEERMRHAYLLADLVISRAGATAIAEIAAWGKPAILVPLRNSAQDHQRENAYGYAERGGAVVIEEVNLAPSVLRNEIERLMADPEKRRGMSEAAKAFARPDAAELIAKEILALGLH